MLANRCDKAGVIDSTSDLPSKARLKPLEFGIPWIHDKNSLLPFSICRIHWFTLKTFSMLLAPGEFPSQRPVMRGFDVFFDLRLNKRFSKQSRRRCRWIEMPLRSLWRHCNDIVVGTNSDIMTSWNRNAFRNTGPLWGEPPVTSWFLRKGPVIRTFIFF